VAVKGSTRFDAQSISSASRPRTARLHAGRSAHQPARPPWTFALEPSTRAKTVERLIADWRPTTDGERRHAEALSPPVRMYYLGRGHRADFGFPKGAVLIYSQVLSVAGHGGPLGTSQLMFPPGTKLYGPGERGSAHHHTEARGCPSDPTAAKPRAPPPAVLRSGAQDAAVSLAGPRRRLGAALRAADEPNHTQGLTRSKAS
jgi:hypothetical protein